MSLLFLSLLILPLLFFEVELSFWEGFLEDFPLLLLFLLLLVVGLFLFDVLRVVKTFWRRMPLPLTGFFGDEEEVAEEFDLIEEVELTEVAREIDEVEEDEDEEFVFLMLEEEIIE